MTVATSSAANTRHGRRELMDRTALLIGRENRPHPARYTAPRGGVKIARRALIAVLLVCAALATDATAIFSQTPDSTEVRDEEPRAVRGLSDRDRRILELRFFHGWTQEQIARDIGVTQMQVSRLLARILTDLRAELS